MGTSSQDGLMQAAHNEAIISAISLWYMSDQRRNNDSYILWENNSRLVGRKAHLMENSCLNSA